MKNLFAGTPIRSVYVKETKRHWFSAVDVCTALLGCDYQKGRNYWKWYKHSMELKERQQARITNQLKLQAADGRLRLTDVLDPAGVLRLIMLFPGHRADKFKMWIAKIAAEGKKVTKYLSHAVNKAKDRVRSRFLSKFYTTEKRDFDISGSSDFYENAENEFSFFSSGDAFIL